MKSIVAVIAGSIFIIVVILILELIFLFAAVEYKALVPEYPSLENFTFVFRYLIGFPAVLLTMFAGGYMTASIANELSTMKLGLHCFALGLIAIISTVLSALENAELTVTGIVMILLTLIATSAGGFYWRRVKVRRTVDTAG